jgi:hypothetical protein
MGGMLRLFPLIALFHAAALLAASGVSAARDLAATAAQLDAQPRAVRARFVDAAVAAVTAAYRAEARRAGERSSWARGARAYNRRLSEIAAAARAGAGVRVVVDAERSVRVVVAGGRQFIVAGPNPATQATLERAVLQGFCPRGTCGAEALSRHPRLALQERPPSGPRLALRLGADDDGLRCNDRAQRHPRLIAAACNALFADLRALARALHARARAGATLDWRAERLFGPGSGAPVSLRALSARHDALAAWLRARLYEQPYTLALEPPSALVYALATRE